MTVFNPFFDYPDPEPILRDVFHDPLVIDGNLTLFETIEQVWSALEGGEGQVPWFGQAESRTLDREYLYNHSGGKFCAPIVKELLRRGGDYVDDDGKLSDTSIEIIARILITKYRPNWQRLWDVNSASYNPINNYDMVENRVTRGANSEAKVDSTTRENSSERTFEHGRVDTTEHGRTTDSMSYKYGINTDTSDPKPSDKDTMEEGGDTVTSVTGSDIDALEEQSGTNSTTNSVGATEEEEEVHRSGNIGVTTTQKMIEEERRLWVWNYFDQIFSDIDKVLALSFHDPCRV